MQSIVSRKKGVYNEAVGDGKMRKKHVVKKGAVILFTAVLMI